MNFEKIGLQVPEILLPNKNIDLHKWSVVACDQYTSQPDYWAESKKITDNQPSTLNVIFPEVFLEDSDGEQRIKNINASMQQYLDEDVLLPMGGKGGSNKGFVLVDRKTSQAPSRKGLVVAIDLEQYDFNKGSQTLIRATEGTIVDRLPPRIKVRQDAAIELPHIMVLIDDPERTVIEPLFNKNPEQLYNFELMMNSGHLKGYAIDTPELIQQVADALEKLATPEVFANKYNAEGKDVLLYAMGDGNHSLATAKAIWEKIKQDAAEPQSVMNDPARYALVELVNIHDEGLQFEPIHRVIFNVNPEQLLKDMHAHFSGNCSICRCDSEAEMKKRAAEVTNLDNVHIVPFNDASGYGYIQIENPVYTLELATIESFLNDYLDEKGGKVDFIHGDEVVNELGVKDGNMGFF
ncbi:MAG: DUF1015 domain-containing protein, partial [Gammaproteobacteria bacterium]|nr:DUF1015 domain-containing protein [Gammaproteobacteria bacterium]